MLEKLIMQFGLDSKTMWVIQIFIVVFLTLFFVYLASIILRKLQNKFDKTKNHWDDAIVHSIKKPIKALIWILGMTFAIEIVHKESDVKILSAIYPFRDVAVIAVLAWFVSNFIKQLQISFISHKKVKGENIDYTTIDAICKLLRAAVVITACLIILQTLGFSVSGVLAFGGVGGLALGFAAKDLLANFFGALMIYFDRPFKVGEWIRSPDKEIEGVVEEIGWRLTRIRTFDKRPLYVPNSVFTTVVVENPSRMTNRRIFETIGVRYCDTCKLETIVKQVEEMLKSHDEIDQRQTMIVNVNKFSASSVDFFIYIFTKTTDWILFHKIKQDVLLRISTIIEQNEAQIAFPTSTLHIADAIKLEEGK